MLNSITGTVIGGGAALGFLVGCWSHIKTWSGKIYGLFVVRARIEDTTATAAFSKLLLSEFRHAHLAKARVRGTMDYVRPEERTQLVAYEMLPTEPTLFWRGWRPVLVTAGTWGWSVEISILRGVYDLEQLILEAVDKFNAYTQDEHRDRFFIRRLQGSIGESDMHAMMRFGMRREDEDDPMDDEDNVERMGTRPIGWQSHELGQPLAYAPEEALVLPEDARAALAEMKWWRQNASWFRDRSLPWKRGWLLHGPAGTGKSSFVRVAGQVLNMPVCVFDLATMNNRDFCSAWSDMMKHCPCIVLFEDIDTVFHGRENVADTGDEAGLSFDCLLNVVDGVENSDGVLLVITTNHPEAIDPALASVNSGIPERPGRVDRVILFDILDAHGRERIAQRILRDWPQPSWEFVLSEGQGDSGARFQERCRRAAMRLLNDELSAQASPEQSPGSGDDSTMFVPAEARR